ncbi:MAG: hypothetical protein HOV86_16170 [Thermoactinospora sp.]|nr:hypothetical protein [Thermoactinospora sp.]
MNRRLAGVLVALSAATSLGLAGQPSSATVSESAEMSAPKHLRQKIYIGRCKDTCKIRVRVTNISRTNIYRARLTVTLRVNGHKMGTCRDTIGDIRARRVKWGECTIRTDKLDGYWDRWEYGDRSRWYTDVRTVVSYTYYR